ncbi:MAG: xanthine dehydrogenase family protein subunit M [Dehalococcoidia bacterium]|nr:xanthine dehydrogenase family protein subunit M [Dehalococcoidia bacterium]
MYSSQTEYQRAGSVQEAVSLLAGNEDAKVLAGGHSLIPLMKLRLASPSLLVDIGQVDELNSGVTCNDGTISISSLTTHAAIASSDIVKSDSPMLAEAAGMVGDPAVRNRGTIGGNLAHSDPASDLPTVLTALGATINITGPSGSRSECVSGFIQGLMENNLGSDEIITSIDVPAKGANQGMAYAKLSHPASRYAVVGAAASVIVEGGTVTAASVAVGGVQPAPTVGNSVAASLVGNAPSDAALDEAASAICNDIGDDVLSDIFASEDYRKAMAVVYTRRALGCAVECAG